MGVDKRYEAEHLEASQGGVSLTRQGNWVDILWLAVARLSNGLPLCCIQRLERRRQMEMGARCCCCCIWVEVWAWAWVWGEIKYSAIPTPPKQPSIPGSERPDLIWSLLLFLILFIIYQRQRYRHQHHQYQHQHSNDKDKFRPRPFIVSLTVTTRCKDSLSFLPSFRHTEEIDAFALAKIHPWDYPVPNPLVQSMA